MGWVLLGLVLFCAYLLRELRRLERLARERAVRHGRRMTELWEFQRDLAGIVGDVAQASSLMAEQLSALNDCGKTSDATVDRLIDLVERQTNLVEAHVHDPLPSL